MSSISRKEILVVSDGDNKHRNCAIYDLKTGTMLVPLKDGHSVQRGMARLAKDYLIAGLSKQPAIIVWLMTQGEPQHVRMPCAGIPTALAVSECGNYCAVGIDKLVYVWHVVTGSLYMRFQQHSAKVTVLRFSSDGSRIISGSQDGTVLVWKFSVARNEMEADNVKPLYAWMDHGLEITDIFVGGLGMLARVYTVSKDRKCHIYELHSGILLTKIRVGFAITAVTVDSSEEHLYLGSDSGEIYRMALYSIDDFDVYFDDSDDKNKKSVFNGHTGEITCLSISEFGDYLISGSADTDCRVWDLKNFACIKKIPCTGVVTNAFTTSMPPGFLSDHKYRPAESFSVFKMSFDKEDCGDYTVQLQDRKLNLFHLASPDNFFDSHLLNGSAESLESTAVGKQPAKKVTAINWDIYSYSLLDCVTENYTKKREVEPEDIIDDY